MEAIYIPQLLKAPEKTEEIPIHDFIAGLETLTPIRGRLVVTHQGSYLDVTATVETIVTLICDRCLQQYNHRLSVNSTELIWLDENADPPDPSSLEREVKLEDLSEMLPFQGYFQPEVWLYEQLCLAMPLRQLCDPQCQAVATNSSSSEPQVDRRWATLEVLKRQLSQ